MNCIKYVLPILVLMFFCAPALAHGGGMGFPDLRAMYGESTAYQGETVQMNAYAYNRYGQSQRRYGGGRAFVFEPRRLRWSAFHGGRLIASGRASGGRGYCPDVRRSCRTPVGRFRVHHKGSASCVSSKFPLGRGGAPMPYCMFFRGGYAIHGSPHLPNFNASHGCIRVHPRAARWLHQNFIRHGTRVIVRSY